MADIGFRDLSAAQLVAMGDGFMLARQYGLAARTYRIALRDRAARKGPILSRYGLAASPTPATPAMFRALLELETLGDHVFVGAGLATWMKPLHFWDDERFVDLAARHADLLAQPNWHWNLSVALWAVQEARRIDGDLVELGVFRGHTSLFCAEYVGFADWPKAWWLIDTFAGIPEDQLDPGWAEINTALYACADTRDEVAARFSHMPNVRVIEGRVPEILAREAPERIAYLHLDLNNAMAEIAALDWAWDRLSPGGLILLDDYGWQTAAAQRQAEETWCAARGVSVLPLPTGQGLLRKP